MVYVKLAHKRRAKLLTSRYSRGWFKSLRRRRSWKLAIPNATANANAARSAANASHNKTVNSIDIRFLPCCEQKKGLQILPLKSPHGYVRFRLTSKRKTLRLRSVVALSRRGSSHEIFSKFSEAWSNYKVSCLCLGFGAIADEGKKRGEFAKARNIRGMRATAMESAEILSLLKLRSSGCQTGSGGLRPTGYRVG